MKKTNLFVLFGSKSFHPSRWSRCCRHLLSRPKPQNSAARSTVLTVLIGSGVRPRPVVWLFWYSVWIGHPRHPQARCSKEAVSNLDGLGEHGTIASNTSSILQRIGLCSVTFMCVYIYIYKWLLKELQTC